MERVIDYTVAPAHPGSPPDPDAASAEPERRRLEHLLAGYQMFLGHDLPNQLVAIQGFARHLESAAVASDPDAAALLGRLADLTRRADRHSRRLAEIGRLLREPPYGEPVSLRDIVRGAVASVRSAPRCASAGATPPVFECVESMPAVTLNGGLLYHVLVELLHNAVAALHPDRQGVVSVQARLDGGACALTVRDNGRGFCEARLARLGEPGQPPPTASAQGLGYFLVLQAVARWGGRLLVRSAPGEGAAVTLILPSGRQGTS